MLASPLPFVWMTDGTDDVFERLESAGEELLGLLIERTINWS